MKALLLALVAASVQASATNSTTPFDSVEQPHAGYIIELEPAAAHSKRDTHVLFHRSAQNSANYSVRHEFTNSEYFYGLSVDASKEDASILAEMPGVKNIWPNRVHARPSPYRGATVIDGDKLTRRGNTAKAEKVTVAHVTGDSDIHSALKMANVDKVHKLGFTGKGVKIGIIDSGIDYRHPALGGGFGPGFKVAGGYDLVGEDYTGQNKPVPDSDPLATCLEGGHGTHVAGIIGARDPKDVGFGLLGVAPDATLYAYRIFSCTGSAADDVIMQGFEKAASDGVDLISMSAGYSNIWETNSPYAPLMKSLRDKNIGLIIAAGNDGERGPYFASTPALTQSVIAVGSVANTKFTTIYRAKDSAGQTVEYARIIPISDSKNKFNVFTVPTEESGCSTEDFKKAASAFPNKDRVIAVLARNSRCLNDDNMAAAGIKEVWIEGKEGVDIRIEEPGRFPGYTVSEITPADGKKIRDAIAKQGANYTVTFSDQSVHDTKQGDAGLMNIFSTMGPTMEMSLKPQISAPGGNILSTWAAEGGIGYAVISGTSMSTPFLSGVYALIKSSNPKLTTNDIRRRIQNSASQVVAATKRDVLAPASYQGAGLVDALKAVNTKFTATPAELSLRDSTKPKAQTITIENKANVAKTYTLSHKGAAIIYALPNIFSTNHNQKFRWSFDNDIYAASYASAKFSSTTVKVAANSKATFQVTIQPPTDFDVDKLPVYSGFITITADDKESISVPYVGVPYERNSVPVLDTTNLTDMGYWSPGPPKGVPTIPLMMNQDTSVRNNDIGTYKFKNGDLPGIFISIRQPSAYVRLDVVPVDTPFKPDFYGFDTTKVPKFNKPKLDVTKFDNIANVTSYGAIEITHGDPSLPSAGELGRLWRGWGAYTSAWQTPSVTLNNGTTYQLPNADYRLLLRVMKWGQDYRNPESYESWLSPIARVQYTK